jgi:hypothetical protein
MFDFQEELLIVDKEGKIIMILTVCWLSTPKALEAVKIDSSKSR